MKTITYFLMFPILIAVALTSGCGRSKSVTKTMSLLYLAIPALGNLCINALIVGGIARNFTADKTRNLVIFFLVIDGLKIYAYSETVDIPTLVAFGIGGLFGIIIGLLYAIAKRTNP
jgi:hypothetical protein